MADKQASFATDRGEEVTMRPMMKSDRDALSDFFRGVPCEDQSDLKDDVTPASVVSQLGLLPDTTHPGFFRRQG